MNIGGGETRALRIVFVYKIEPFKYTNDFKDGERDYNVLIVPKTKDTNI